MVALHAVKTAFETVESSDLAPELVQQTLTQVKASTGLEGTRLMTPLRHALTATRVRTLSVLTILDTHLTFVLLARMDQT